jgi:protein phosphatase
LQSGCNTGFSASPAPAAREGAILHRVTRPIRPRADGGPFDLIGDVHGCIDELRELLALLGYDVGDNHVLTHRQGRRVVFLGDIVDRGPGIVDVLRIAMASEAAGTSFSVVGNHDDKLLRALRGRNVQVKHGLAESLAQLEDEPPAFRRRVLGFLEAMPSHLILARGTLVAAHAGLPREWHDRTDEHAREVAMYGITAGGLDEDGLPIRVNWARQYSGPPCVVYGHTPVVDPVWYHDTIDVDTGCVFGHRLSAVRFPEKDLVSVPALREYARKSGPFRRVGPGGEKVADFRVAVSAVA